MATIADSQAQRLKGGRPRVRLAGGDFVDPGRYLETIHAQWEFCRVLNREAPVCVEDLYCLLPITESVIRPERETEQTEAFKDGLIAWCTRWHMPNCVWMFSAGLSSLVHYALLDRDGFPNLKKILIMRPLVVPDLSEDLAQLLESLNPGWQDQIFEIVIPPQVIAWHPTRTPFDDIRAQALAAVEEALSHSNSIIENELMVNGAATPSSPILEDWFVWAVRRVVLDESYRSLSKQVGVARSAVRKGAEVVLRLVDLPKPT